LQLVRFFWTDAFLSRLLDVSISKPDRLSCNLSCLLSLDWRPVPTLSLFPDVVRDLPRLSLPDNIFLLASALRTAQNVAPERTSTLLDSIDDVSLRENAIRVLYMLGDVNFIRHTFRERSLDRMCVGEKCIAVGLAKNPANCEEIDEALATAVSVGDFDGIVALKFWALNSGKDLLKDCVVTTLGEPLEQAFPKILAYTPALFIFEPSLDAGDVVDDFRAGVFKDFNFLDQDISELSNIEFSRLRMMSSVFARRIVDQLEVDPAAIATLASQGSDGLIAYSSSGARFEFLICKHRDLSGGAACNREAIYLAAISELFR
jgi:hypothetical protein